MVQVFYKFEACLRQILSHRLDKFVEHIFETMFEMILFDTIPIKLNKNKLKKLDQFGKIFALI